MYLLASGDVTSSRSEALGERAHQDVDVFRVEVEVVDDTPASGAHCSNLNMKKNYCN